MYHVRGESSEFAGNLRRRMQHRCARVRNVILKGVAKKEEIEARDPGNFEIRYSISSPMPSPQFSVRGLICGRLDAMRRKVVRESDCERTITSTGEKF